MTALLTDNLSLLAGAPNGIKKLRELILELAVRGKLVPQDPNDEPASGLLKRIAEEKARLVAEGKIKKTKALPEVSEEEQFFELPIGWTWCRLQDAFDVRDGTHDTPKYQPSGYPLVTSKNLSTGKLDLNDVKFISEEDHLKISARSKVDRGDILFAMIGSIGNPVVVDTDIPFSIKNVALLKRYAPGQISTDFLLLYLLVAAADMREKSAGGVQSFVSLGSIRLYPFAFPALSEQHRIVAKVDELMALCDRLEAQQADADSAHAQLVQALLDSLTQARDAGDFAQSWQRLAEHFHTLFTTESSIDALKQTLLQLAVMGKLVPQYPNDEPASELLKLIAKEKGRWVAEGKIRKQKPLAELSGEEKPFELPAGWVWTRLGDICLTQTGTTPSKSQPELFGSDVPFIKPGDIYPDQVDYSGEGLSSLGASQSGRIAQAGSLLMVCIGTIGKCNLIERNCSFNQQINSATLYKGLPQYLRIAARSAYFQAKAWSESSSTTIAILNKGKWEAIPIPLPGLAEQHRIAAKVDELMALCDQLKARLNQARQVHEQLANALVERAVA